MGDWLHSKMAYPSKYLYLYSTIRLTSEMLKLRPKTAVHSQKLNSQPVDYKCNTLNITLLAKTSLKESAVHSTYFKLLQLIHYSGRTEC